MFSVHHDIIWFLIIILILVYWCLYKIVKDFSWKVFNRQDGPLLYIFNSILILIESLLLYLLYKLYAVLFRIFIRSLDSKEIHSLGVITYKHNDLFYYFNNLYVTLLKAIFGFQYNTNSFDNDLVDIEGKLLFNHELVLFDSQILTILVRDFNNWNLSFNDVVYLVTIGLYLLWFIIILLMVTFLMGVLL